MQNASAVFVPAVSASTSIPPWRALARAAENQKKLASSVQTTGSAPVASPPPASLSPPAPRAETQQRAGQAAQRVDRDRAEVLAKRLRRRAQKVRHTPRPPSPSRLTMVQPNPAEPKERQDSGTAGGRDLDNSGKIGAGAGAQSDDSEDDGRSAGTDAIGQPPSTVPSAKEPQTRYFHF